jgi:integrase
MIAFSPTMRPRLRHRGKVRAVRDKYQRPTVRDVGNKWKITYWDYSSGDAKHRSKVWAKSLARTQREAQRLSDVFMEEVNAKNNDPKLYSSDERTLAGLQKKCQELTWPLLKKPTRMNYEYFFDNYLVPQLGKRLIDELETMELQSFFNSFIGRLSPYTIKNMHAALRAALAQAVTWGKIDRNPAIGVKLPKKKAVKPPVLLTFPEIKMVIGELPEPTKTIVILIVFASMRVGEALALRWNDILSDRVMIDERLYDDDLDDPKTLHGNREVPFDQQGIIKQALEGMWAKAKFRKPEDFVFATRTRTPTERRNVLRHLKAAAIKLKLGKQIDFRSFRTMHASLMRRTGARAEVTRDNMGHSECATSLEIYSKTWWDERAAAVSAVVDLVMKSDEKKDGEEKHNGGEAQRRMLFKDESISAPTSAPAPEMVQTTGAD